jgi:hypothetical protein
VRITAKQWWWQVEYLDADPSKQFTTANELHLPVDRTARIELRSRRRDPQPVDPGAQRQGRPHPRPRQRDLHDAARRRHVPRQCAEFCGLQHANMALDVQVDDRRPVRRVAGASARAAATPSTASARPACTCSPDRVRDVPRDPRHRCRRHHRARPHAPRQPPHARGRQSPRLRVLRARRHAGAADALQLARPDNTSSGPDLYNQIFTMHGTTMMFLFAVPVMEAMGVYLVPLMVGTRNIAFPRLNAFSYWIYLFGGIMLYVAFC